MSIRKFTATDVKSAAFLHLLFLGADSSLEPLLQMAYTALVESPLAVINVLVDDSNNQVKGLALGTTDSKRLISDLFSRCPSQFVRQLLCCPSRVKKMISMFTGNSQGQALTEILAFRCLEGTDPKESRQLLQQTLSDLAYRGADSVCLSLPEASSALQSDLLACDFVLQQGSLYKRSLDPNPNYVPGPFTFADRLRCAFRFELMVVLPVYCTFLIPFASYLAHLGQKLDRMLGLPVILDTPWNYLVMALFLLGGGLLLVYSYSYLILEGEGGPVPPWSAKTRRLVTIGPYTYIRHPSIVAKLIGVIGLGIGFNSYCFICFIVPLLLTWSIIWNGSRQDGDLIKVFGEEYLEYRRNVPMILPRIWRRHDKRSK